MYDKYWVSLTNGHSEGLLVTNWYIMFIFIPPFWKNSRGTNIGFSLKLKNNRKTIEFGNQNFAYSIQLALSSYPWLESFGLTWNEYQRVNWFLTLKILICSFQARLKFYNQGQGRVDQKLFLKKLSKIDRSHPELRNSF